MTHRLMIVAVAVAALTFTSGCEERQVTGPQAPARQQPAAAPAGAVESQPAQGTPDTTGTTGGPGTGTGPAKTDASLKRSMDLYQARCATCHGPKGAGDGPAAGAFQVRPRSFQDKDWQAQVTDEHIRKITIEGGMAVGKSPAMPAAPDLARDDRLDGLVQVIRGFGGK